MCPSCGAPIQFGVGSSIAKVCEFCRTTIVRSDRGLQNLGRVADLALTPSLIAVGDQGTLAGRPFQVLGRVQLDHGAGPWDEYYVAFDYGQAWGWLAYAQGHWYVTAYAHGVTAPPFAGLRLEMDVPLGGAGVFRVGEIKSATIRSTEGELPAPFPSGSTRRYADLLGPQTAFATLDYGDSAGVAVFLGWMFSEPQMQVTQLGPRSIQKVKTEQIKCPSCGGDLPKLSGERAERVGCGYCGAISDIAAQQVVLQQERAMRQPDIPIGALGKFDDAEYICIATVRRGSDFDGDHFSWDEYLLWSQPVGFRWLVKDPESGWSWVVPANLSELDISALPSQVSWGGRSFSLRNENRASVEYVLGEVYWKCQVGETTAVTDFTNGKDVLSREEGVGEVHWSYSTPIAWPALAQAFGLPPDGPGGNVGGATTNKRGGCLQAAALVALVLLVLIVCAMMDDCGDDSSSTGTGAGTYRGGSGVFYGGK
jgi:hypothetical protein